MSEVQRILVVDDEVGPRESLRLILDPKYQVMTAVNGPEAIQVIRRMPHDLVFLDVKMPGMSGIEVLKVIKQVDSSIEAVMMTAFGSLETVRDAMAYGASEYLIKPFSEDEVEGAVAKALARRVERTGARLEVRTLLEQLRTLAHASATAADQQDLLESASVVLEQVKRLLGAVAAILHVVGEPSRRLSCKVCLGVPAWRRGEFDGEVWVATLRQMLKGRLPRILSQDHADPRFDGMARALNALGYRGGAFFPMLAGEEELGVLSFLYELPQEFRGEWADIGRTVAELMALSIRMHQRYHASQREASQQAQRAAQLSILREVSRVTMANLDVAAMLKAIGDQLQSGLGYAGFHVWLYGSDDTQLRQAYGSGPNHGWQPSDAEGVFPRELRVERSTEASVVLAPILLEGTTTGIIKLVREARQGPIAEIEIELLRTLLDYIGLAVKHSQLYAEIKETKGYLENLIDSAGDAIITVNGEDRVTSWNPAAERIFGYRSRDILHQMIGALFPQELYEQWRDEVLRRGGVKHIETRLIQRDGEPIDVSLTLSPLRGPLDELVGLSAIMKDVTENKQLREQLLHAEKLSALGEMAAGIAHNFNNVLTTILGRVELLARNPAHGRTMQPGLAIIKKAAEDAAAMVQRIQKFAKGSAPSQFALIDLNEVVKEAVEATQLIWKDQAQREGKAIDVVMDLRTLPPVRSRSAELREVLTNLILNAIDAMPAGGTLTLRTRHRGRVVCVEVSDTGTGMTDEVKRRIFDPFFTTKGVKGTGLGLSVSHLLIKGHNGDIQVQSEPQRGTTFSITLPSEPGSTEVRV